MNTDNTYPHPGEDLRDILDEMGINQITLSRRTGIPPSRINEILKGRRSITAEYSIRLGRFFGQGDRFWLNLQKDYDVRQVLAEHGKEIQQQVMPLSA